jgi:hypothetical protein
MDWHSVDLAALNDELRTTLDPPEAEKIVYALEEALRIARVDDALLDCLLVAAVCLRAHAEDDTPRGVLERVFRRSVSDAEWRERYAGLLE